MEDNASEPKSTRERLMTIRSSYNTWKETTASAIAVTTFQLIKQNTPWIVRHYDYGQLTI